jgi:hypothetical protein
MSDQPELLNAARDRDVVDACTSTGQPGAYVEHDYRTHLVDTAGGPRRVLRCVWCHAVACGNADQDDPCIEPWHHEPLHHRTAAGVTWPIGGTRP